MISEEEVICNSLSPALQCFEILLVKNGCSERDPVSMLKLTDYKIKNCFKDLFVNITSRGRIIISN